MPGADPRFDRYRLVLIAAADKRVLVEDHGYAGGLPRVSVPRWTRTAEKITAQIREQWGFRSVVLDILGDKPGADTIVIAERLNSVAPSRALTPRGWSSFEAIPDAEVEPEARSIISGLLANGSTDRGPFSRLGWVREMLAWSSGLIGRESSWFSEDEIEQLNGSAESTLIRLVGRDGAVFWFKAAGGSNSHEARVTSTLSSCFPKYLPEVVGFHSGWNAWLMRDSGLPFTRVHSDRCALARDMVRSFAELQRASTGLVDRLIADGCHDHRMPALRAEIPQLAPYLEEAMHDSELRTGPVIERARLDRVLSMVETATLVLEDVGLPNSLMHCDISLENILVGSRGCIFTDWAHACVGNPFVTFEQLRIQLSQDREFRSALPRLTEEYLEVWRQSQPNLDYRCAFAFVPIVALASYLCCRREWLTTEDHRGPQSRSYARILARQMDHAARLIEEDVGLCA